MNNEEEKNKIMANLRNLKDQVAFKGLSVTDDYTIAERQMIKEWTDKVKENNDNPQILIIYGELEVPQKTDCD